MFPGNKQDPRRELTSLCVTGETCSGSQGHSGCSLTSGTETLQILSFFLIHCLSKIKVVLARFEQWWWIFHWVPSAVLLEKVIASILVMKKLSQREKAMCLGSHQLVAKLELKPRSDSTSYNSTLFLKCVEQGSVPWIRVGKEKASRRLLP